MNLILILKKSLLKELQIIPYLRNSKIIASLLLLTGSFFLQLSFFELFIWARGLRFHPCPKFYSSPTYKHMRWPRKVSNILQTSVKFSKNPSGKTLQNCFIHKSSTGSGKRSEQNSYNSPPLVGKSHEEDTITTPFDWKKQKPILLVDRWKDQSATEVACSKRSDSGERCEIKKAMKSRGGLSPLPLPRFYFFALLFTSRRSPLSERLEQATTEDTTATGQCKTQTADRG